MKKIIIYLSFIIIIPISVKIPVNASAFSMGNIQSVASNGSLDVIRNPALITLQEQDNSIGFFVNYQLYNYYTDYSTFLDAPGITDEIIIHEKDNNNTGIIILSYCKKFNRYALGFALSSGDSNQIESIGTKEHIFGIDSTTGNKMFMIIESTSTQMYPAFVFSFGFISTRKSSIGLQITAGYLSRIEEESERIFKNLNFVKEGKTTTKIDLMSSEIAIGYSYRTAASQLGLIIKSGRLSWKKMRVEINNWAPNETVLIKKYADITTRRLFYGQYDMGVSFIFGGYKKITDFLGLSLEYKYIFPVAYKNRNINFDGENKYLFNWTKERTKINSSFSIHGGTEISFISNSVISLGANLNRIKIKTNWYGFRKIMDITIHNITAGYDYTFNSDKKFFLGLNFSKSGIKLGNNIKTINKIVNSFYINSINMKANTTNLLFNISAGISYGF